MELFSEWVLDEGRQAGLRPKKHAAVPHTDIDRWLKSVDGLAKDLKDLQGAKKKAQDKIDQIGRKYKPEDKPEEKPDEKKPDDKHREEKPDERKPKQPRLKADREVLPARPKPERESDEAIVKRRLSKPKPRPEREPDETIVKHRLGKKPKRPIRDEDIE